MVKCNRRITNTTKSGVSEGKNKQYNIKGGESDGALIRRNRTDMFLLRFFSTKNAEVSIMKKRALIMQAVILLFIAVAGLLSGCNEESLPLPYNASGMVAQIKDSFLYAEENRISVAYRNENYDPEDPNSEKYFYDDSLPSYRVILLKEQSQLEEAFEAVPSIDLEQQMVAVILFSLSNCSTFSLENIVVENGVLKFIKLTNNPGGLSTAPDLVNYTVSMDKVEATEADVTFI